MTTRMQRRPFTAGQWAQWLTVAVFMVAGGGAIGLLAACALSGHTAEAILGLRTKGWGHAARRGQHRRNVARRRDLHRTVPPPFLPLTVYGA